MGQEEFEETLDKASEASELNPALRSSVGITLYK